MRERAELHEHIGDVNLAATTKAALRRAREALQEDRGRWGPRLVICRAQHFMMKCFASA